MVCLNTERIPQVEHQLTEWEKDATCSGLIKTCNSKQEIVSSQDWQTGPKMMAVTARDQILIESSAIAVPRCRSIPQSKQRRTLARHLISIHEFQGVFVAAYYDSLLCEASSAWLPLLARHES